MGTISRRAAKHELTRLLEYWRQIEYWIKKTEQIQKRALIPAINELRYASRQLFNATRIYGKGTLTAGDRSALSKRIIIAEQYLINADHDICDAVLSFIDTYLDWIEAENNVAPAEIQQFFPDYISLRTSLRECAELVANSRAHYSQRQQNYGKIRKELDLVVRHFHSVEDAAVKAVVARRNIELQLRRANIRSRINEAATLVSLALAALAIWLGVVLWNHSSSDICTSEKRSNIFWNMLCEMRLSSEDVAGNVNDTATQPLPTEHNAGDHGD